MSQIIVNTYEKESAKGSIWVWQGGESGQMVLKKGEMDLFLCISMPNNAKKIDEKAQTAKFTVFTRGSQLCGAKNLEN